MPLVSIKDLVVSAGAHMLCCLFLFHPPSSGGMYANLSARYSYVMAQDPIGSARSSRT